jgi:hypothetical protein
MILPRTSGPQKTSLSPGGSAGKRVKSARKVTVEKDCDIESNNRSVESSPRNYF